MPNNMTSTDARFMKSLQPGYRRKLAERNRLFPKQFGDLKVDRRFARWWMTNEGDLPREFRRSFLRAQKEHLIFFNDREQCLELSVRGRKVMRAIAEGR